MKRWLLTFAIFVSLSLIVLSGWLGYSGATWPMPMAAAAPTPNAETKTITVTRGDVRQVLTVAGTVIAARKQLLSFPASGKMVELAVNLGDACKKGQTLARLDTEPLELSVAQAQADLLTKQAALDKLTEGATDSDLTAAKAAVQDAQTGVQNAEYNLTVAQKSSTVSQTVRDRENEAAWYEVNYGEMLNKYNAGKITKDRLTLEYNNLLTAKEKLETARAEAAVALNQANQSVASAKETLRKAQLALKDLETGATQAELEEAQAAVQSATLTLKQAQTNLAGATLLAPFDGKVLTTGYVQGDTVSSGSTVITLADLTQLEIQTTVGQEDVGQVKAGESATITLDAKPGETYSGKVSRVVPTQASSSGAVNYTVYVAIDKVPEGLLPGMTGDADLVVAESKNALTLPRRSIRAKANSTLALSVLQNGKTVTRSVKTGLLGDLSVEILSGLEEGDQVVTSQ